MMNLEEFSYAVLAAVRYEGNGDFNAWITTNIKNNGVRLTGIASASPHSNGGPCVYLNNYYEEYRKGRIEVDEVARNVCCQIMKHKDDLRGISFESLRRWNAVKAHIYVKLINREMNRGLLGAVPHRQLLDLVAVYFIKLDGIGGNPTILIYNEHMEKWGQDEEGLYRMALKNMRLKGEPVFEDMDMLLKRMLPECAEFLNSNEEPLTNIYVLSNRDKFFGAAEILDEKTLKNIGNRLGEDFVILPSSVHETIIIPLSEAPPYSELTKQVREVNEAEVEIGERLSDHVYLYARNEGALKIVA